MSPFEAWAGIEPAHRGFADRSVTTSPPRLIGNTFFAIVLFVAQSLRTSHSYMLRF